MYSKSNWAGERLVTSITNEVMLEHLHRYALAIEICKNKKVLDIACGEGYGANLLSLVASEVIGIDVDSTTINNAKRKYFAQNISFQKGSILEIPVNNDYFDIIVSFETLEHVSDHEKTISELKRVLHPDGILLISTPDKLSYSEKTGNRNIFHKKELYKTEFMSLLKAYFKEVKFLGQSSCSMSMIINETKTIEEVYFSGDYNSINVVSKPEPVYWIAMATDNTLPLVNDTFFLHPKTLSTLQQEQTGAIHRTLTYRVGNVILAPLKFLKRVFGK